MRRSFYIQPTNSLPSQFKVFQRPSREVAGEYLDSDLRWIQQVELSSPPAPHASLPAPPVHAVHRFRELSHVINCNPAR